MRILIIEDEPQAVKLLQNLIAHQVPEAEFLVALDTIAKSVAWFRQNTAPDLVFMDIQLADGVSFDIFKQVDVAAPVIFTTAYDEYALRAFKVNSIDYLLKPVNADELKTALTKFKRLKPAPTDQLLASLQQVMQSVKKPFKERFVLKVGEHLKSVEVQDILYFFSQEKTTFAQTKDGRKHILDFTLDELESLLNPQRFFRINRKYIVALSSIQDMIHHSNARLRLVLHTSDDSDIVVARERVQEFKDWLDR